MSAPRVFVCLALIAGCARDPIDTCPEVGTSELVVTEIRSDDDQVNGQWVELFNASGRSLDLEGMRIRFRQRDGGGEFPVIVRHTLVVGAGGYIVLGRYTEADKPPHVQYGFLEDYDGSWLGAGAVDMEACGENVDLAQYDALPETGTFSLGGTPDAEANDLAGNWCFDPTPTGTPGAANTPCP